MTDFTEINLPLALLTNAKTGCPVMVNMAHVVALAENDDGTTEINLRHRRDILVSESLSEIFDGMEERGRVQ